MRVQERQDAIVRMLRRNGTATVDHLSTEVGASRRTILRDICALRDQGFTIYSETGPGGGVQLDPQSMQTTPRLSVPEVFALLISVSAMRAAGVMPFAGQADAGLMKIEKALPADKVRDLRRMLDCLHIGTLSDQQDLSDVTHIDADLLPTFEYAFLNRYCLRFTYRDAKGAVSLRLAEPQAILILPPLWYLVAWDRDREGFRHFRMDRISAPAHDEDAPFRPRHVPFEKDICPYRELERRQTRAG